MFTREKEPNVRNEKLWTRIVSRNKCSYRSATFRMIIIVNTRTPIVIYRPLGLQYVPVRVLVRVRVSHVLCFRVFSFHENATARRVDRVIFSSPRRSRRRAFARQSSLDGGTRFARSAPLPRGACVWRHLFSRLARTRDPFAVGPRAPGGRRWELGRTGRVHTLCARDGTTTTDIPDGGRVAFASRGGKKKQNHDQKRCVRGERGIRKQHPFFLL